MRTRNSRAPRRLFLAGLLAALAASPLGAPALAGGELERTPAPTGAEVYLISPANGATVSSPVTLRFGLRGMGVAPAGIDKANTGHHHVLIDTDLPPLGLPLPNDAQHRHFGGGQTEASLELTPGEHTLQLVLGDARHIPHEPPVVSEKIVLVVH